MGFLARLLRFIFWVWIVSWAIRLMRRLFGAAKRPPTDGVQTGTSVDSMAHGKRLVKDPVCGMHLAEELALPMDANGETHYFCSQECRSQYHSAVLRRSANA